MADLLRTAALLLPTVTMMPSAIIDKKQKKLIHIGPLELFMGYKSFG